MTSVNTLASRQTSERPHRLICLSICWVQEVPERNDDIEDLSNTGSCVVIDALENRNTCQYDTTDVLVLTPKRTTTGRARMMNVESDQLHHLWNSSITW